MQIILQISLFAAQLAVCTLVDASILILMHVFMLGVKPPVWIDIFCATVTVFLSIIFLAFAGLIDNLAFFPVLLGIAIAPFISTSDRVWLFLFGDGKK